MNDVVSQSLHACCGETSLRVRHLIIGSGVGGSIAADWHSKTEDGVLIIEEGPDISELPSPSTLQTCMKHMWREGGIVPIESNARFVFAEGRVVGGGSMVNAGILHRLPEDIRADWEKRYAIHAYRSNDFEPFYKQAEKICAAPPSPHTPAQADRFRTGANNKGWNVVTPLSTIGLTPNGTIKRRSMRATYLERAANQGAKILTRCRAYRIHIDGERATELEAEHEHPDGSRHLLRIAFDHITIACGALQTPVLLQRSGIQKNIGNTLRFHPTLRITAEFSESIRPWSELMSTMQIKALAPHLSFGMSLSWPVHLAASLTPQWPATQTKLSSLDKLAMYYVATTSHGTGSLQALGKRHYRARYALAPEDIHWLQEGYRHLATLLRDAGAKHLSGSLRPGTHEDLPFTAKNLFAMSIHAFSSCPMGEASHCPVDSYGRLKGFANISIQDASLLPEAPSVNPQLTIMATVLRNLHLGN